MIASRVYRDAQPLQSVIDELRRCTPDQFDPEVVEHLIRYVSTPGYLDSRKILVKTSSDAAVAMAGHLQNLHGAVASENLKDLKLAVEELKDEAEQGSLSTISEAANRLEDVLNTDDSNLSQVMEMAEEVMQLCRSTRQSLLPTTEASPDSVQ